MDNFSGNLDSKYKNIGYAEFNDSMLLSKNEKRLIKFFEYTQFVVIFGLMIVVILYKSTQINDSILAIIFIFILCYGVVAVFSGGRYVMHKCVTLLGKEYYDYKEKFLLKEYKFIKRVSEIDNEWCTNIISGKNSLNNYILKKKRFPLMFSKGVIYYFDYNIFVFWDENSYNVEWKTELSRKKVNIIYHIKSISVNASDELYKSLLEPGYTEEKIDSCLVRHATIYYNEKTNEIIHRPRVILLKFEDYIMRKFKYAKDPSVIVDFSIDLSNYVLGEILKIDLS
ncbi:MAG: hypothetical protein PQJ44_05210 [Sphaerochaetaceae bacterium]|nr:hypothetical protein [Sphaerochaetaceae bacterium]